MGRHKRLVGRLKAASSGGRTLLTESDFTYLGSFKLPTISTQTTATSNNWHMGHANAFMTGRYVSGTLHILIGGRVVTHNMIMDVTLPGTLDGSRATLSRIWNGTAYSIENYMPTNVDYSVLSGIKWDTTLNKLMCNYHIGYNQSPGAGNPSIFYATLTDADGSMSFQGPWRHSANSKRTGGWLTDVPSWFQSQYGVGRVATGNLNLGQAHVYGTTLCAFNPCDPTSTADTADNGGGGTDTHVTITDDELCYHNSANPLSKAAIVGGNCYYCPGGRKGDQDSPTTPITLNDYFGGQAAMVEHPAAPPAEDNPYNLSPQAANCDWLTQHVWIDTGTKHGVLAFGNIAAAVGGRDAHFWYGNGWTGGPDQDVSHTCDHGEAYTLGGGTGPTATAGVNMYCIYNPSHFGEVKLGTRNQYSGVAPAEIGRMGASVFGGFMDEEWSTLAFGPIGPAWRPVGQCWFDTTTNRLYVAKNLADNDGYNPQPVVHVFEVA